MPWPILGAGKDGEHAIGVCEKISLTCVGRRWCITCMSSPACLRSLRRKRPDYLTDALAEARFASALVKVGYHPVLDTPHRNGKHPDALILSDNQEVFIDVILPERSDHI